MFLVESMGGLRLLSEHFVLRHLRETPVSLAESMDWSLPLLALTT